MSEEAYDRELRASFDSMHPDRSGADLRAWALETLPGARVVVPRDSSYTVADPPMTWTIDVCRTCGKLAIWPFCEHRPDGFLADLESWCFPVPVQAMHPADYRRQMHRGMRGRA